MESRFALQITFSTRTFSTKLAKGGRSNPRIAFTAIPHLRAHFHNTFNTPAKINPAASNRA
jgi:hypothetical protein